MSSLEEWEVLDLLSSLVDKSLVVYEEQADGTGRYRLLETVRQYGRERLADSGEGEVAQGHHLGFYLALAEEAEPYLKGPEQGVWFNRLETDHDNLRAALRLALETSDQDGRADAALNLCGKLGWLWSFGGYLSEGRAWCADVLALPPSAPSEAMSALKADVLYTAGQLAGSQGDYEEARGFLEQSRTLCQETGYKLGSAKALFNLGGIANIQGDYKAARSFFEQSMMLFQEVGAKRGVSLVLNSLGILARDQGDYKAARSFTEQSLTIRRELGDKRGIAGALNSLGHIANNQGDYEAARSFFEQNLTLCQEMGDKGGVSNAHLGLGFVASSQGEHEAARGFYEQTLTFSREVGSKAGVALALYGLGGVATSQGDYAAARSFFEQSLMLRQELGDKKRIAMTLGNLGELAGKLTQWERRVSLYGAAVALRTAIGAPLARIEQAELDAAVAEARAALEEEAFAAAWNAGQAMTLDEAVEYALTPMQLNP